MRWNPGKPAALRGGGWGGVFFTVIKINTNNRKVRKTITKMQK